MLVQLKNKYNEICRIKRSYLTPFFFLYYIVHKVIEDVFIRFICIFYRVDNHQIILRSFPDYADNGQALAEYLVDNGYTKKYRVYYDVSDLSKFRNYSNDLKFISFETELGLYRFRWLKVVYTAKYLMFTHRPIIIKKHARKEQVLINLFHGNGYKDRSAQQGSCRAHYDYSIVSGNLFVKPMAYFWNIEESRVFPIGFPRYKWLVVRDNSAATFLNSYKQSANSKVVMWMPTFRVDKRGIHNESTINQFPLIESLDDWMGLDKLCYNHNIILLVKLHPFQKNYAIPFGSFANIKEIANEDFERACVPMYKLLALTDALISDYSSVAIDYLLVDHPIAFALQDFDAYKDARGFVFEDPRVYMPGHHLYSFDDLKRFLKDVSIGNDPYQMERKKMRAYAVCQSDDYCKGLLEKFGIV